MHEKDKIQMIQITKYEFLWIFRMKLLAKENKYMYVAFLSPVAFRNGWKNHFCWLELKAYAELWSF